jgi:Mce-associated membrane protein
MDPSLYDILGVPGDASADQIKRAWRDAADRFEPGSGGSGAQFRLFNEAAEVLLDPAKRASYDAGLAARRRDDPAGQPRPAADTSSTSTVPEAEPAGWSVSLPATRELENGDSAPTGRSAPWPLLATLAALALVLVVAAAWYGAPRWRTVRAQDTVDEAARSAPAVGERAAAAILSYDYRSLDTDEAAAARYLTPKYRKEYMRTFDKLVRPNAAKLKAHVEAQVKASGVSHADADRVNVLLFVDQVTTSTANGGDPQPALNRVELSMVKQHGSWLVNDITSY